MCHQCKHMHRVWCLILIVLTASCNSAPTPVVPAPTIAELQPTQLPAAPALHTANRPSTPDSPFPMPDSPLPTPIPDDHTSWTMRVENQAGIYRGASDYPDIPEFEITYDPVRWTFTEPDRWSNTPKLVYYYPANCSIELGGGSGGASPIGASFLAGRLWNIGYIREAISYSWNYGNGSYTFYATLPDPYTPDVKSPCQLAVEEVINTFRMIDPPSDQPESPLVLESPPQAQPRLEDDHAEPPETWATYTSLNGGYTFRYPSTWTATSTAGHAGVSLIPPSGAQYRAIRLGYLTFEILESTDLLEWLDQYHAPSPHGPELTELMMLNAYIYQRIYTPVELNIKTPAGPSRQVYMADPGSWGQGFYFTHGRLVFQMYTYSREPAHTKLIYAIANSLEFSDTAPATRQEIGTTNLPDDGLTTLEEYLEQQREERKISTAIELRIQTGKTPTYLLNTMPDWARVAHEERLAARAVEVERADARRAHQPDPFTEKCEELSGAFFISARAQTDPGLWYWRGTDTWPISTAGERNELSPKQFLFAYTPVYYPDMLSIANVLCGITLHSLHPDVFASLPSGDGGSVRLHEFAWLPDSRGILFNTATTAYPSQNTNDLYQFDLSTGESTQLFPPGEGGRFEFSPDGTLLAVMSPHRINLLAADTLETLNTLEYAPVMTYSSDYFYPSITWLEDGSGIATAIPPREDWMPPNTIEIVSDRLTRVWRLLASGDPAEQIVEIHNHGPHFLISSDLQHVIYSSNYAPRLPQFPGGEDTSIIQLRHLQLATGQDTILYSGIGPEFYGWLPDGNSFLMRVPNLEPPLLWFDLESSRATPWFHEGLPEKWIDNRRFLYTRGAELWMGDLDGGKTWLHEARGNAGDIWLVPPENNPVIPPP